MERFRNIYTTLIGAILMMCAVVMYVLSKWVGYEFSLFEIGGVAVLGWVFLRAKDSLLEGVFMGIFKVKK